MGEVQQIEHAPIAQRRTRIARQSQNDDALILMIERAARDPSVDIDKMERLMAMQERAIAHRSSAAFAAAFASMQAELPSVAENGTLEIRKDNRVVQSSKYALWEDINDAIKPVLSQHGFGLRFEVGRAGDRLSVTGVLTHREGHSERTTMELPADTSGSKNAVQAVGSSTSYGKRYVAAALLNLTSRLKEDRDDDGAAAISTGPALITEDQVINLRELVQATEANLAKFVAIFKVDTIPEIPASKYMQAVGILKDREKALRGGK